jgi:excisionase family DNA binding protein
MEADDESPPRPVEPLAGAQPTLPSGRLLLRVDEVAKALAISRSAVYALIRSGELTSLRSAGPLV